MKRILITGANSYIGTSVEKHLAQWPEEYQVDTIEMVDGSWREKSFAGYDSMFHVAGIAHQDSGKITEERKQLYYKVNTNLTIETAKKAKAEGVGQFIFMSSIIVYGASAKMGDKKVITRDTVPSPVGAYGDSKLQAEKGIEPLNDDSFKVCILRPPMIYGPGCKGNYRILEKYSRYLLLFPKTSALKSTLHINNLSEAVKICMDEKLSGTYLPANRKDVSTSDMVSMIRSNLGRNTFLTELFNPALILLSRRVNFLNKLFGGLVISRTPISLTDLYTENWSALHL